MIDFNLKNTDFIELCDLLKITGLCQSGGAAKSIIAEGKVKVNGVVELRKRCKIYAGSTVAVEQQMIQISKINKNS